MPCIFGRPWWWKIIIASVKGVELFRQIHYNLHTGLQVDKYTANIHCDVRVLIVFTSCHVSRTNDRRCPPSSFHGTTIAFHYFYTPFGLVVRLSPCLSRNTIISPCTTTNDRCRCYNYCVRKKGSRANMAATVVYKIRLALSPKQMSRVRFYAAVLLRCTVRVSTL